MSDVCLKTRTLCLYFWNILPLYTFHNINCSLLKFCHWLGRFFAAMPPQFLKWCLFSVILLPCLHASCVSWLWLHVFHALSLCTLCATLWSQNQDIVEDFGLWVLHRWAAHEPGLAGGGQRCFQPWAEPQEPWAPSLAGSQGYHNTFAGTSWANLCPGRLECSPESLMQSAGSLWLRKSSCFQQWHWQTDPGASCCRGLFKIFLPPAACKALPHKVTLAGTGWQKCVLQFPTGANILHPPWYPEHSIKLFLLSLVCRGGESWNQKCL